MGLIADNPVLHRKSGTSDIAVKLKVHGMRRNAQVQATTLLCSCRCTCTSRVQLTGLRRRTRSLRNEAAFANNASFRGIGTSSINLSQAPLRTSPNNPSLNGRKFRLAVIGSGPAGFYAASRILSSQGSENAQVDMYEELPVPFGLVRYGVAPDHPEVKVSLKMGYPPLLARTAIERRRQRIWLMSSRL